MNGTNISKKGELEMGFWDIGAIVVVGGFVVAITAIVSEFVKFLVKHRAKVKAANNDQLSKVQDLISTMQDDLDEIKTDLRTVVIQMDDLKVFKVESSVVDE